MERSVAKDGGPGPVVIEVAGSRSRSASQSTASTRSRSARPPFTRMEYREHRALRDVSFDVHQGEFFGIVGRNGSGKSTLLKILASIYRATRGRIRMAGRLAPFIELGVGFNPELTARENVVLNGVMMGLTLREARRRLDAVLEFAELEEFVDLKLKNYSSGMLVRLAFAVMVQADADIMLIDEVLAVGDAAFAQKCMDVFHERRDAGKTIVLVTHDMATVQSLCHRAMLIDDGELRYIGEPGGGRAALLQAQLRRHADAGATRGARRWRPGRQRAAWSRPALEDETGERVDNVEQGDAASRSRSCSRRARDLAAPVLRVPCRNEATAVFGLQPVAAPSSTSDDQAAGQRVRLAGADREPRSLPGRYFARLLDPRRTATRATWPLQALRLLDFVVYGTGESRRA